MVLELFSHTKETVKTRLKNIFLAADVKNIIFYFLKITIFVRFKSNFN